jgi:hypothetical protein
VSTFYEQSHYVIENKGSEKRTKPNKANFRKAKLETRNSKLEAQNTQRMIRFSTAVPKLDSLRCGYPSSPRWVGLWQSTSGSGAKSRPPRRDRFRPALLRSGDFDLSGAFGYRGH